MKLAKVNGEPIIAGDGVFAKLLKEKGIKVIDVEEL